MQRPGAPAHIHRHTHSVPWTFYHGHSEQLDLTASMLLYQHAYQTISLL